MATPFKYLLLFTGFSACAQFDSGALAAFESYLQTDLKFTPATIGVINAVEYMLLPVASPLIPWLFRCFKVKLVLLLCLAGNMVGVFGLAIGPMVHRNGDSIFTLFILSRAISGVCHAGIAVYGSVWVDLQAPKDQAASWLGAMQASSLVGLVVGYSVAGYSKNWEVVFFVNLVWFALTFVGLMLTPTDYMRNPASAHGPEHSEPRPRMSFVSNPSGSFIGQTDWVHDMEVSGQEQTEDPNAHLVRSRASSASVATESIAVYWLMALCVSSLFFVSGGLQFWVTPYMKQVRILQLGHGDKSSCEDVQEEVHTLVVTLVAVITATAPTFGVFFGGALVDNLGGYKGHSGRQALQLLAGGAVLATAFGFVACFSEAFWVAVVAFWVFNMLGAALLPGAFGLMLAAVRTERRSMASAAAQVPINLLGMAGGAIFPGWLTGCTKEDLEKVSCVSGCNFALGIRSLLVGPALGFLFLALALLLFPRPPSQEVTPNQELGLRSGAGRRRATTAHSIVMGVIDQLDGKAGTMVLRLDEDISLPKLLAKAAECTGNATRRLFSEDGQEILSLKDVQKLVEQSSGSRKQALEPGNPGLSIDLEVVSTDGTNFKWKWGSNHAHYRFGDLLIRPLWRTLAGSRDVRSVVHPPQPIPLPTSGNLKDCLPDLWIQCFSLCERYGPLVKLRVFDDIVYVVADPDIVDIVNQIPDKRIPKEVFGCPALAGQGVFIADGQRWEFARHAFQAQLTPEGIDKLIPIFATRAWKLQGILEQSTACVDIFNWIERVTMDSICDIGFGHDLKCMDSAEMPALLPLFEEVLEVSINSSLYGAFDIMGNQKRWFQSQLEKLNGMLDEIIDACRDGRSTGSSNSLLRALMGAKCPLTGRSFTQSELQDQLLTMLVAGHKTTTLLLTWSLYYIGRNPQVEKKLFAELRQVFGNDTTSSPNGEVLRRLKYMDMVVRETLRLCAPVQVAQRGLTQPVQCGKYTLLPGGHSGRGNSWVAIHIMGISLSKKYWGDTATEFIPERFEAAKMANFHPFQFMPFGGGRRLCIGNLFAITQAKTLLSILLRKFYVRIAYDKPVKMDPKDIATPLPASKGGGVWMNFTSREYDEPAAADTNSMPSAPFDSFIREAAERQSFAGGMSFISRKGDEPRPSLLILWGGEFGTTLSAAQDLMVSAEQREFPVELKALDEVEPTALLAGDVKSATGEVPVVLILVATYNGHPPPNAAAFVKELSEMPEAAEGSVDLNFAVLGVGNSNWVSTFVKVAKDVEKLMIRAGANRLLPLEAADKNDYFERQLRTWRKVIFSQFASSAAELIKESEGEQRAEAIEEKLTLEPFQGSPVVAIESHFVERLGYQKCAIGVNEELCLQMDSSSPSVRQIVVSRPGGSQYACGDHLEVRPRNSEAQVLRCCRLLGIEAGAVVVAKGEKLDEELPSGQPIAVGDLLAYYVDLAALPSQEALASFVPLVANSQEAEKLRQMTLAKEDSEYERWCKRCLSILDILEEYPSLKVGVGRFVEVAPKMKSRLYSIASSPLARGTDVELCCRVATYEASPLNSSSATRKGICSSMLAAAASVVCRVKEAPHMRLPQDVSKPIACVCGGTGIAPFLGFLQERDACKKKGMQTGVVTLYFGCRNETDFLHKSQLQTWHEEGLCSLKVSQSRPTDGSTKEYVYHALRRESASILELLEEGGSGGYFYVCGSASTLAKDVTNVLLEMLSQSGDASIGFSRLTELQEQGRVIFDVWG